jgi:hypothetical protein
MTASCANSSRTANFYMRLPCPQTGYPLTPFCRKLTTADACGRSMVDHLRFRLRSIFELAVSEGAADRNPALALYSPRDCRTGRERKVLSPADLAKAGTNSPSLPTFRRTASRALWAAPPLHPAGAPARRTRCRLRSRLYRTGRRPALRSKRVSLLHGTQSVDRFRLAPTQDLDPARSRH